MKRISKMLMFVLILSLMVSSFAFGEEQLQPESFLSVDEDVENIEQNIEENDQIESLDDTIWEPVSNEIIDEIKDAFKKGEKIDNLILDEDDEVRIIVELEERPLITYATEEDIQYSAMPKGELDSLERELLQKQEIVEREIHSKNISFSLDKRFTTVFNGFSGKSKFSEIDAIENIVGVRKVYISKEYERPTIKPDMHTSNDMVRSLNAWNLGFKGEGMVVAIIDTGIDPSHSDMVLTNSGAASLSEEDINVMKNEQGLKGRFYTEKVPYGYNYYDKNEEILDIGPSASEHGMHVAGTVAANGYVKGVAPESQLLAMKVFSNDPIYATTFDDIYLEAIEEAIKLGANVLNMSLGSTASFYVEDSPVNKAISYAVDNGIVCSISAGNSGYIAHGWTETNSGLPTKNNPDIGLVGAPGLSYDSIQVASFENTHMMTPYLILGDEKIVLSVASSNHPVSLGSDVEYVDCGVGDVTDFEEIDVSGKIALIIRGGLTFVEKIVNAEKAGAIGVIVYNHKDGGEELINMAYPPEATIPAVFVGHSSGDKMLESPIKTVSFTDDEMQVPNPMSGQMSDFSSWGTTPSLELKPEITAPGGQIYSTLQNNSYGTMSGTSMSAPHVSGGAAIVKEYISKNGRLNELHLEDLIIGDEIGDKVSPLPNNSIIIGNRAYDRRLLDSEYSDMINEQILKAITENEPIYIKTSKGNIITLFNEEVKDLSVLPKTLIYMDIHGNETVYTSSAKESSIGEQTKLAKILLMNTAKVLLDEENIAISPRKQGAGLMDVESAIVTPVIVVNRLNNEAKVELFDFNETEFDLNLRAINTTDKEITYSIDLDLLTDYIYQDHFNLLVAREIDKVVSGPDTITIPAKDYVDFTLHVDFGMDEELYRNMFVEGFVRLADTSDTYPELSIPFLGFYGSWDEPEILDGFEELGEESYYGYAGMIDGEFNFMIPSKAAISPGTADGEIFGTNIVIPIPSFMRNAEEVRYNILDSEGNKLSTILTEQFASKTYIDGGRKLPFSFNPNRAWDGKINGEIVEDGLYYYEIESKIHYDGARWQEKKIPVYVDTKAPEISNLSFDKYSSKLKFEAEDSGIGLSRILIFVNNKPVENIEVEDEQNLFEIDMLEHLSGLTNYEIKVVVLDYAGNMREKNIAEGKDEGRPVIYLINPELLEPYNENVIKFSGYVFDTTLTPVVKINGIQADVSYNEEIEIKQDDEVIRSGEGYEFELELEFEDGYHEVEILSISQGGVETSIVRRFWVDTTEPELTVEVKERELTDESATLEILMKDNFPALTLYINGSEVNRVDRLSQYSIVEPIEESFTFDVDLDIGINELKIVLVDMAGNMVEEVITIERTE
ncbi:S8 family serine peptidase [Anaerosalibacter sp. Marseille-P3206]|uniref:S8 family serine peptidase n=1 Tax=Anaerosalibacter sp. Marseille-P3206 TaxID=1871005 RepID=UPI0009843BA4|nr:S8 family serine peptidase [Anaerosalibacter sp. Marseille-P3206]